MEEHLILVDEKDNAIGIGDKISIHIEGRLHRAFSIFTFNARGDLLLQRRARNKYHSGGLWSNTCCSHPRPTESVIEAAHRRLKEEMGFDCELREVFSFIYETKLDEGFIENEFDHVLLGRFDGEPTPDANEVCEWKWMTQEELKNDIKVNADAYTYWLKLSLESVMNYEARLRSST